MRVFPTRPCMKTKTGNELMRNCEPTIPTRCGAALLASVAAALLFALPSQAQLASPFKITNLVLNKDGGAVLQWQGADTNIVVQFTADVGAPVWQPLPGVEWPISGTSWSGVIPMSPGTGFLRVVTTGGVGTTPVPLKTISLELIRWHDLQSDNPSSYLGDCVACHGTRTQERALDGTTPSVHSIMLNFFGQGNDRCKKCHYSGQNSSGPDFLTHSAGSLRKQVNYETSRCTVCHAKDGIEPLYDR